MSYRDEHAGDRQGRFLAGSGVADPQTGHGGLAIDREDGGVGEEPDLVIAAGAGEHDPGCPEFVPAVHECDAAGEPGQEGGLFHGGVTAADHGNVLIFKEEAITGGARAHPAAQKFLLSRDSEVAGRGPHGQDHGTGAVRLAAGGHHFLDRPVQRYRLHVLHLQVRPESQGLFAHLVHEFRAGDAGAETGVVLHLGGGHQRAAERGAFEHQGAQ